MKPSKTPTPQMILAAETLLVAMAHNETVSPVIISTQKQALQEGNYRVDQKIGAELTGQLITDPEKSFLMSDENYIIYNQRCIELQTKAGFEINDDKCPKLMAEGMVRDARKALIESVHPITNITPHQLLCAGMQKYEHFVDITLSWITPYVNTKKTLKKFNIA